MVSRPRLIGLSGSIRKSSACTAILQSVADHIIDRAELILIPLMDIPLYNADDDGERMPMPVRKMKEAVEHCDGLIVISPEYNYGVSGVLKNAVDWISRPAYASPLKGKPILTMTASPAATGGVRAQQQMRDLFAATLSRVINRAEIVIPSVYAKIVDGRLSDDATRAFALAGVDDLLVEITLLIRFASEPTSQLNAAH